MHMRYKPWAKPELAACPFYRAEPETIKNHWREQFAKEKPLCLELGCGKGVSTCQMTKRERDTNFVAVDLISSVLGVAKRNIEAAYGSDTVDNVILTSFDITVIDRYFGPEDTVERIYIHFCNPWNKRPRQAKKRLTHPRQLLLYRAFLRDGGEIWFKTDDDTLFDASVEYFSQTGFSIRYITRDLHADGFTPNYESEHEKRFAQEGIGIKFLIAVKDAL